ncbi:tellurium resistance protein [Massilia sp. Dwa41.01b]|uniref:TerD family protein n=1 Tax=unclassified Massilia TaxID=2609279 RepID=UPI001603802C|nr:MULTISPECIES: TerD family protein [unclassified Massilia]QNA87588.1 tellurium resistance protein [Massilia sp. Dwa41.01b]QNA98491.1 tellurium resistance protein [Massilia sp. Se16.2.3]
MNIFSRGQKGKLADLGLGASFPVEIDIAAPGMTLDVSCFGLDGADKLSDERYMVFYNQLASPGDAVRLQLAGSKARFDLKLDALPSTIAKLVFVAAIDGAQTMRALGASSLTVGSALRFPWSGADFGDEKAVIVAELYRRDGQWRFGAVGQGFNGGLSALLKHFGGSEAAPPSSTPAQPAPAPVSSVQPKVSLSKVTLEKRGDKVSLEKRAGGGFGRIHVNLNWNQSGAVSPSTQPEKTGFLGRLSGALGGAPGGRRRSGGIDLDLGCMFELADGRKGLVQALGNAWGDYDNVPYIKLDADDRTGSSSNGENLYINGERFDGIRRALIFSFIYEGVPNWGATDGVVTIAVPNQAPVEVRLDGGGSQMMCAIAMIENQGGRLQVTKLAEYFEQQGRTSAHELMDQRFQFGLRWKTGSKD